MTGHPTVISGVRRLPLPHQVSSDVVSPVLCLELFEVKSEQY